MPDPWSASEPKFPVTDPERDSLRKREFGMVWDGHRVPRLTAWAHTLFLMASSGNSGWLKWLVIVAVLGGGAFGYVKWRGKAAAASGSADLRTNVVARGDITQSVTANGGITPVRVVTVGSQISGIITELKVDFNSRVKEGDVLVKIDPATYERAMARAEAELANPQAGLELAKFNAQRSKELFAAKLVSETEN